MAIAAGLQLLNEDEIEQEIDEYREFASSRFVQLEVLPKATFNGSSPLTYRRWRARCPPYGVHLTGRTTTIPRDLSTRLT